MKAKVHWNKIDNVMKEVNAYLDGYENGHIEIELATDFDDNERRTYYIVEIAVYGYVDEGNGVTNTRCRRFEYGFTSDKDIAIAAAVKASAAMSKVTPEGYDLNGIVETEY